MEINGQQLESNWDGIQAHGHAYLDVYDGREATWSITCLYDSTPSDGSYSNGDDVVHLLRLQFDHSSEGFTVSYTQRGKPAFVRFSPNILDNPQVNGVTEKWRQPALDFDQDIPTAPRLEDTPTTLTQSLWQKSQSLLSSVSAFQERLTDKIRNITCGHKDKAQSTTVKVPPLALVPFVPKGNETRSFTETESTSDTPASSETLESNRAPEDVIITDHGELVDPVSTPTIESTDSTNTTPYFSAAETRSLHTPEEFDSLISPASDTLPAPSPNTALNHRPLKIFALVLILSSLLVWCILRCTDPRRRVDRAARREERRNKRLYKRAARRHMIKTWFSNFRIKFKLVSSKAQGWDEKQARVVGQEEILEDVMKNEIRALRNAHRVVSNITAAEEGQNDFEYEAESSERRRSVTTLPGYESEGSQPPSYEASRSFESATLVGSSVFAPADIDSNPDSSVVSTSPRISRDGTNSDFDEKIEALSLEPNPINNTYRVYNRV